MALAASFLYLPHGLRVLATLIGGRKIIPGLFLGHVVSGIYIHLFANGTGIEILDIFNLIKLTLLFNIESFFIFSSIKFLLTIKKEKISAISSDGIDLEYSVKKPLVFSYKSKFNLSEQVEHSAYSKSELLNKENF